MLGEKPVPLSRCLPQISHDQDRDRNRAPTVKGQRLTTWYLRPKLIYIKRYIGLKIQFVLHTEQSVLPLGTGIGEYCTGRQALLFCKNNTNIYIYIYIYMNCVDITQSSRKEIWRYVTAFRKKVLKFVLRLHGKAIHSTFIYLLWRCDPTRVMASSFLRFF